MTKTFDYEVFIPFYWSDPAGILFFGQSFSIAHLAFEQFVIHKLSMKWNEWFQNPAWIVPVKQAEAHFSIPLFAGKNCLVKLQIADIRTSSFTSFYHIFQDEKECCVVKTVHVFCDRQTKQKQDIPFPIKTLLETWREL